MISSVSSIAGAAQAAPRDTRITGGTRRFDITGTIEAARAESAAAEQEKQAMEAKNAAAIQHFAQQGMSMTMHTYTSDYKDQLAASVDGDGSKDISVDELTAQVSKGGGSAQQAAALYAAMDADKDGKLSLQEFKDSIADPYLSAEFRSKLADALSANGPGRGGDPAVVGALFREQAQRMDAASVLGLMAQGISEQA